MSLRAAGALAALAAAATLAWLHQHHAAQVVLAAVEADRAVWQARVAEVSAQARIDNHAARTTAALESLEILYAQHQALSAVQADVARARSRVGSLQRTLEAVRRGGDGGPSGQPTLSGADAVGPLTNALGQCSGQYAEVAGVADRLSVQVTGLQAYITRVVAPVCLQPAEQPPTTPAIPGIPGQPLGP